MQKVTIYLAVYGAFLSSLVFLWEIVKFYKDRPKMRVEANIRLLIGASGSAQKIGIDMINSGKRPVTIVSSGFKLDVESQANVATVPDMNLPLEISEGQRHTTFVNPGTLEGRKILYAWARDATGREYFSKKRPLQPVY
jgi:hypothetical protein